MTDFIFPNDILTESTVFWCWSTEISLKLKHDARDGDEICYVTIKFVIRWLWCLVAGHWTFIQRILC